MNERMNMEQVKERFIIGIHDNYTLNLAISLAENFEKVGIVNNNLIIEKMKLEQQLKAKQDKEDKLREYIEHNDFSDWHIGKDKDQFRKNDLLRILNEEVK